MKSPRRIFFVEDERDIAEILNEYLKALGYVVCGSATSVQGAISGIQASGPDLVLVDLMIGGSLGGIAIGDYLSAKTSIPFIYITGYDESEVLEGARQTTPDGILLKPFDRRQLRAAIEMARRAG